MTISYSRLRLEKKHQKKLKKYREWTWIISLQKKYQMQSNDINNQQYM